MTPVQAAPEPLDLNIEKLAVAHRPDYDADVLQPIITAREAAREAAEKERVQQQRLLEQNRVESRSVVQAAQASVSCLEAARATWPPELLNGASMVIQRESGGRTDATGHINADGSQDFGCFQINNKAHPAFFAAHDWSDPYQNARYGYQIYRGRGWASWYAVKGLLWQ
jgi:hypothetical protein